MLEFQVMPRHLKRPRGELFKLIANVYQKLADAHRKDLDALEVIAEIDRLKADLKSSKRRPFE
jgi:hypothetical protein